MPNLLNNKFLSRLVIRVPLFLGEDGFAIDEVIKELQVIFVHNLSPRQCLVVATSLFLEVRNVNFLELFFLDDVETRLFGDLLLHLGGELLLDEFVDFVELFV